MKIALVHDDLVQWGGLERVLVAISQVFPEAPIYTSLYDRNNPQLTQFFTGKKIHTSFLQKLPFWRIFYKVFLPLYPLAFESFDLSQYEVIISLTTRFAKSVITHPNQKHICICFTPPRFLWHYPTNPTPKILEPLLSYLRLVDQVSAKRVDLWVAGGENIQKRIKQIYKVDAEIIAGFIDIKEFEQATSDPGDYYLLISRLNSYKRLDIAVEAFSKLNLPLKIIGKGSALNSLKAKAAKNIEFLTDVDDTERIEILARCRALIVTAEEDFGLTPLEAQILGKAVIAFGRGGALETVKDGQTGVFFNTQTAGALVEAIERLAKLKIKPLDCIKNARRFSKQAFQDKLKSLL